MGKTRFQYAWLLIYRDHKIRTTTRPFARQYQLLLMLLNTQPALLEQLGKGKASLEQEMKRRETAEKLTTLSPSEKLQADEEQWDSWLKMYVERLRQETDGKSDVQELNDERVAIMKSNNPKFVLRNYVAQNAISKAEKGDYSEVKKVLQILSTPFSDVPGHDRLQLPGMDAAAQRDEMDSAHSHGSELKYDCRPPDWALDLKVT